MGDAGKDQSCSVVSQAAALAQNQRLDEVLAGALIVAAPRQSRERERVRRGALLEA